MKRQRKEKVQRTTDVSRRPNTTRSELNSDLVALCSPHYHLQITVIMSPKREQMRGAETVCSTRGALRGSQTCSCFEASLPGLTPSSSTAGPHHWRCCFSPSADLQLLWLMKKILKILQLGQELFLEPEEAGTGAWAETSASNSSMNLHRVSFCWSGAAGKEQRDDSCFKTGPEIFHTAEAARCFMISNVFRRVLTFH